MIIDDWEGRAQVLVLGTLAYAVLILVLRVSGKRTLAKMNAFDLVVTVALGSILASTLLSKDVPLAEGVAAFLVLVVLQFVIAALSVRYRAVEKLAKSDARALLTDGVLDERALRGERVTRKEVMCAVRGAGLGDLAQVASVVLETDGSFSVVSRDRAGARTALPGGR